MKKQPTTKKPTVSAAAAAPKRVGAETRRDVERALVAAIPGYASVEPTLDQETGKVISIREHAVVAWLVQWKVKRDEFDELTSVQPVTVTGPTDPAGGVYRQPDGQYCGPQGETFSSKDDVIAYLQTEIDGPQAQGEQKTD